MLWSAIQLDKSSSKIYSYSILDPANQTIEAVLDTVPSQQMHKVK